MPQYRRAIIPGATYFFTVNTQQRRPLLTLPETRDALRNGIIQTRRTLPFWIDAWVLLPDHMHCIWTLPPKDANFSARWAIIKRQVSRACGHLVDRSASISDSGRKRRESGFWQRRFWEHQIRNDEDFRRHADYLHWNPVKHGYVSEVSAWPHSTFHRYLADGVYSSDWCGVDYASDNQKFGE